MFYTDNRNVVRWIEFERQIRNLAVAVAHLEERMVFIISKDHTVIMAGTQIGKVISPAVQHSKSVAPEGTVGERVNCVENGIHIGFKYLSTGEIVGEIYSPKSVFRAAPAIPLTIEWGDFETWQFSSEVFGEMVKSSGIFSTPADPVQLNIKRSIKSNTTNGRKPVNKVIV